MLDAGSRVPSASQARHFRFRDPNLARSDDAEQIYRAAFRAGLVYGPEFRRAVSVLRDDTVLSTTLRAGSGRHRSVRARLRTRSDGA